MLGGGIEKATQAETLLAEGYDLVYIGRPFMSNPNLVEKLKHDMPLTAVDFDTAYTPDEKGYIDYV